MHFITSYKREFKGTLIKTVEEVAKAGVRVIQFSYEVGLDGHMLDMAKRVKDITQKYNTKLCINNRLDIANIVQADYLHIGQYDIPIEDARRYLDIYTKIGLTVTKPEELHPKADYYGVGPIFTTTTKDMFNEPIGVEQLKLIRNHTKKPIIAIGGVTHQNYKELLLNGATDVAVIGDIYRSNNITDIIQKYKG